MVILVLLTSELNSLYYVTGFGCPGVEIYLPLKTGNVPKIMVTFLIKKGMFNFQFQKYSMNWK